MPQLRLERGAPVATPEDLSPSRAEPAHSRESYGKLKPGPGKSSEDVARNQRARIQSAMAETLAEQDYDAITVRTLARRARISTRAFYQCYSGKEECFLKLHEQTVRSLLMAMDFPQANAEGAGRAIVALWNGLTGDPTVARLMLVDVNVIGLQAQSQARRAQRSLEAKVCNYVEDALVDNPMSGRVSEGVVLGLLGMARSRLLDERAPALPNLSEEMASWALACIDQPPLIGLGEMEKDIGRKKVDPRPSRDPAEGDVALLLNAAAKLAATEDPSALSTRNVLAAAGLRRRAFATNFQSLEDCVVEARDQLTRGAIERAKGAAIDCSSWAQGVVRFVLAFCEEVERDPVLAGFCFGRWAKSDICKMNHQVSVEAHMADLIERAFGLPPTATINRVRIEVSIAAFWGLIEKRVVAHGPAMVSELAPALAYIFLAPAIGSAEAVEVIRKEYDLRNTTREECLTNHG